MKEMDTSPYPLSSPTPELRNAPGGGRGGDGGACAGDANSYINCAKKAKCRAAKTPRASEGEREGAREGGSELLCKSAAIKISVIGRAGGRPVGRALPPDRRTENNRPGIKMRIFPLTPRGRLCSVRQVFIQRMFFS